LIARLATATLLLATVLGGGVAHAGTGEGYFDSETTCRADGTGLTATTNCVTGFASAVELSNGGPFQFTCGATTSNSAGVPAAAVATQITCVVNGVNVSAAAYGPAAQMTVIVGSLQSVSFIAEGLVAPPGDNTRYIRAERQSAPLSKLYQVELCPGGACGP
jgi:hypothetical protein